MGRGRPRTVGGDGMIKLLHVEDDGDIREIAKMSLELRLLLRTNAFIASRS